MYRALTSAIAKREHAVRALSLTIQKHHIDTQRRDLQLASEIAKREEAAQRHDTEKERRDLALASEIAKREKAAQRHHAKLRRRDLALASEIAKREKAAQQCDAEKQRLELALASEVAKPEEAVQQLSAEKEKREEAVADRVRCVICLHKERSVYFWNCRHMVVCGECDENITKCPLCNTSIKKRSKNVIIS